MLVSGVRRLFAAAPHAARLPEAEVARLYPRYRWRIMEATFLGYAAFYLVRNNLSVVAKDIEHALHYDHSMIGSVLGATALSYGVGKFVMGALSDRSNPRVFMATGLLLTALCNFAFGASTDYRLHLLLWSINGFFQGMGWPPCGRSMGHWFGEKERGLTFSIWNTSHNIGGGIAGAVAGWAAAHLGGWQQAFFVPGVIALLGAAYLLWRLRDTPQSVGLPPIEEYLDSRRTCRDCGYDLRGLPGVRCPECGLEFAPAHRAGGPPPLGERELTFYELFVENVLVNKYIWLLAIANFFAYITRYSMLDWGPTYLREVKGASITGGGIAILVTEFGGIPSTILLGWISDLIGGRRGMVAVLSLVPILAAFTVMVLTPAGHLWLDMTMLCVIGFFVYPVINLIVIMALDLTSKKAIGTAAGFIGLLGYLGRFCQAKGFGWMLKHYQARYGLETAWEIVIYAILACTAVAILLLGVTWRLRPGHRVPLRGG
jgi:OPA family glycerol-3-phosphate transporter-like MFS transporter